MENYRLLERLGKGGQGSVYLAENRQDQRRCVLKKVECHDESEANKAFKEAMALQQLRHPYVCGYQEFFVMWDKEESSMFVCIVMDYYSNGDLKMVVKQYQDLQKPMEEEKVKKYLGEILEALTFVHRNRTIHRDLKPSNIFMQDDGTICLGDFGVATIMGDAKTCTRNDVGTTNYMAPEVQDKPYDERSDVWALGCILFEMTTTAIFSGEMVADKLKEIKEDPGVLEEIFEDVAKHFSGDLIAAIRMMLKYNPSRRPTAEQLIEKSEYVKQCVEQSDAILFEKRKRQGESKEGEADMLGKEDPNVMVVLEHIAKNIDQEVCVKEGMEHLVEITKQDGILLDNNSKRLIATAMRNNIKNKAIQIAGCNVLNNIIVSAQSGDILFSPEIVSIVVLMMKTYPSSGELQQTASALLMALSADNRAAEIIGTLGGMELIMKALNSHMDSVELCTACISAIWSLTVNETNLQTAIDHKALESICLAMKKHFSSLEVAEAASAAMFSLCLDEKSYEIVNELDAVGLLLGIMEKYEKNAKIVKNSCMALSCLVEPDEECAYRVLTSESETGEFQSADGIPVIMRVYGLHKDNAEVVESIVTLIMELANYGDIGMDLLSYKVPALLREIQLKFNKNEDIMKPCQCAMQKLGVFKPQ